MFFGRASRATALLARPKNMNQLLTFHSLREYTQPDF